MSDTVNIAAYRFAALKNLKPLRERLSSLCQAWKLKGTILLSTEGINLFVAGGPQEIDLLLTELRSIPELAGLEAKYSESSEQPFHRMLVKIKREIIAFGVEGIDPVHHPAPKLAPKRLKQWLDEGRPVTLLDTRNDYEVRLGTFQNALRLPIDHFRQFPEAVRQLPESLKQQPIVMFCTGGIRCEKAGPFMQREGFQNVFQLDGGILKYFEECGGDHYDGECFVFDHRVGVDHSLHESETAQCFVCQSPLSHADQLDARFVEGLSCPYCYVNADEVSARTLAERHAALYQITHPLPGSQAYENHRPLNVPAAFDGHTVLEFLCGILEHIPREEWQRICDSGRLHKRAWSASPRERSDDGLSVVAANDLVRAGDRLLHILPCEREPDVNPAIRIVYEDEAILVINKPVPLPTHPSGRFNRNSLSHILNTLYHPQSPRPIHRLDANTSGLVLFARTRHFARRLQRQFASEGPGQFEKIYLARVLGHPEWEVYQCDLPISQQPGPAGSREIDPQQGLSALTDFCVLERCADGTSILEAVPRTGRTNQIRVHLWSLNFPICGDPMYLSGQQLGEAQTLPVDAPPLCLLAHKMTFTHPVTQQTVTFQTELPAWRQSTW